jgi:hypothetical protein
MKLNKVEAARRQLNTGIRLFFEQGDPVAVHTVVHAGFTIIRNLCEERGDVQSFNRFSDWIVPGAEKKFWREMNRQASFVKHADNDPDEILEFDPETTELLMLMASKWFVDLGNSTSPEIRTFGLWYSFMYPRTLKESVLEELRKVGAGPAFEQLRGAFDALDPLDRIRAGRMILRQQLGLPAD